MAKPSSTVKYSKDTERWFANRVGARRLNAGEWRGPGDADIDGGWFLGQVKHRLWPKWLQKGYDQTAALPNKKLRALFLKEKSGRGNKARTLVCLPLDDWLAEMGYGQADAAAEQRKGEGG